MWIDRLRLVLRLNALSSLASGLVAAIAATWVSETLGIDHVAITRVVGVGLVAFAANVVYISTRGDARVLAEARLVSAADAAWVIATIVVLASGILTTAGIVIAAVVGVMVADFGALQLWLRARALARDTDSRPTERPIEI